MGESTRQPEYDLHGYAIGTACEFVSEAIRNAWERGCESITFIHGARYSSHHWQNTGGKGGIKWALRGSLRRREFEPYARGPGSRKHERGPIALTIALRPNPNPTMPPWIERPERDYDYDPFDRHHRW